MNFELYKKEFTKKAIAKLKDTDYIKSCLDYAQNLHSKGLPIIYDEKHFSFLVGVRLEYLLRISNSQHNFYRHFTIPKNNSKRRMIAEPLPLLKEIQHFILQNILYKLPSSDYSKAYVKGLSLKDNAKFHRNQRLLLKLDIKDYFNSLYESRVLDLFISLGYRKSLCVLLTKLCTLKKGLPQGAPTSPYLSNLLTVDLDTDIYRFCSTVGKLRYTRYADDISISGSFDPSIIIRGVTKIVFAHNLQINKNKIAVIGQQNRQLVTGIVVNNYLQAPKSYRKSIRLEAYYCKKFGVESHLRKNEKHSKIICAQKYCETMLGKINYCLQINKKDKEMLLYREYFLDELKRTCV